ncbi:hypothetical protein [Actinacidiphila rubida]|uniref:Uncharacterized protein n=1 Tax=Actinacidiphila rubida TaxID=310780 RepID=A0A1H8SY12_9ACTN|nr:hypothetical protein [Actinacidiphila rubida]SEO83043.1 hypothetical protein SAMN05216267_104622 [Actinacidiphila rubida]
MTDQTTERTGEIVDLPTWLASHLGGRTAEEISAEFHTLLDAVREHGKKGSMTITFVVEPPANGVESAPLPIGVESAVKAPKATAPKALYFLDADGNPCRDDPRQMAIPFQTAHTTTEFKDAH